MTAMAPATVTAGDVMQALRDRYAAPEYALFAQVRDSTGFSGAGRTADAIALGLWPSRGLHLHGFEIKVYRNDWQRELKRPEKAEAIARFCHYWWIVAPNGVVEPSTLPSTWGLLELRGRQLVASVQAKFREDATPIDAPFVAALLRRASAAMPGQEEIRAARDRGYKEGAAEQKKTDELMDSLARREAERLKATIGKIEQAAGRSVTEFNAERVGEALRRILGGEDGRGPAEQIHRARQAAIEFLDRTQDDWARADDLPYFWRDDTPRAVSDALRPLLPAAEDVA